jgi:Phosphotransferase enzyme family
VRDCGLRAAPLASAGHSGASILSIVDDTPRSVTYGPGRSTPFVRSLLLYLDSLSFTAAPRLIGDQNGNLVVEFIDGFVAPDLDVRRWKPRQIDAAFALLREFHDVTAGSELAGSREIVCHNDFTPQNTVFRNDEPVGIIDWEFAAPGTRQWDLGHALWQWLNIGPFQPDIDRQVAAVRRALGAYGTSVGDWVVFAIEQRQTDWLQVAAAGAAAVQSTRGRTPEHWAGVVDWVSAELAWLRTNGDRLRSKLDTR